MEQIAVKDAIVRYSEDINYSWIICEGFMSNEEFSGSLSDARLYNFLEKKRVINIVLDISNLNSFNIPDMSNFIDISFREHMNKIGILKISVILKTGIIMFLSGVLQEIEDRTEKNTRIRFFDASQFYDTVESVTWFN